MSDEEQELFKSMHQKGGENYLQEKTKRVFGLMNLFAYRGNDLKNNNNFKFRKVV